MKNMREFGLVAPAVLLMAFAGASSAAAISIPANLYGHFNQIGKVIETTVVEYGIAESVPEPGTLALLALGLAGLGIRGRGSIPT